MPNYLNLPAELQHLLEKRELEERRLAERREAEKAEVSPEPRLEQRANERRTEPPRRNSNG